MIKAKVFMMVDNVEQVLFKCEHVQRITFNQFVDFENGLREAGYSYSTDEKEKVVMHKYTPYKEDPTVVCHIRISFEEED